MNLEDPGGGGFVWNCTAPASCVLMHLAMALCVVGALPPTPVHVGVANW